MSFEEINEAPKWPETGSKPEIGQIVRFRSVENSNAKQPDEWTVMGLSEENGDALVEIWHNHKIDEFIEEKVSLEELRQFNSAR